MAVTAEIASVTKGKTGSYYVTFVDGLQYEFSSLDDLKRFAAGSDADPELARKLCIGWWLARDSAALDAKQVVVGKTVTLDLSAANPFKVT